MDDLTKIWNDGEELNEQLLLRYINGEATADEVRMVEEKMASSSFVNDAVEGLLPLQNKHNIKGDLSALNKGLQKQLSKSKSHKEKRKIKYLYWGIIAVIVILMLSLAVVLLLKIQE